jgi:hypothetical protein
MLPSTAALKPRARHIGIALLLYAATVVASASLGHSRPITFGDAFASAAVTALGTLAMGFYLVRWTPFPRWAFLGAAAVLAVSALLGPLVAPDPAAWSDGVRTMLWMNPWYLMVMGGIPPTPARGWCSPAAPWAGGLLIGVTVVLTLISWGAAALSRLM